LQQYAHFKVYFYVIFWLQIKMITHLLHDTLWGTEKLRSNFQFSYLFLSQFFQKRWLSQHFLKSAVPQQGYHLQKIRWVINLYVYFKLHPVDTLLSLPCLKAFVLLRFYMEFTAGMSSWKLLLHLQGMMWPLFFFFFSVYSLAFLELNITSNFLNALFIAFFIFMSAKSDHLNKVKNLKKPKHNKK